MRHFDLTPLYRASIGFDQIADLMDRALEVDTRAASYPPYNIERTGEDMWRISVAVAGFSPDDLNVELRDNSLLVTGQRSSTDTDSNSRVYLHRGIANRAFERRFTLADHVRVNSASHVDGMLHIDLIREIPEALKPRKIPIARSVEPDAIEAPRIS